MKTLELFFKSATFLAVSCWILLIVFPGFSHSNQYIILIVVALLATLYGYLLFFRKNQDATIYPKGNFSTLKGVCNLFLNPKGVLIGWIHYLAFDLMGLYIKQEASNIGLSHWLQIPCFILTLIFGPLGLLLFFILRFTLFQNL
jgi:Domain of unknown function (DUF4281)